MGKKRRKEPMRQTALRRVAGQSDALMQPSSASVRTQPTRKVRCKVSIRLITKLRSNAKDQLMPMADKLLLHKRALSETIIDQLKNIAQIEYTRLHRDGPA